MLKTQIALTIAQKIKISFPNGTEANVLRSFEDQFSLYVAVFYKHSFFFPATIFSKQ
jgi:hypothetical protein